MGSEKKKQKNFKGVKNMEFEKIVQSCKNLLYVNTDHSYAAPIQSDNAKPKKNKGHITEPESETDEVEIVSSLENNNTTSTKERSPPPNENLEIEAENISLKENIESLKQIESNSNISIENVDSYTSIESIFLKEEIIETSADDIEEKNKNSLSKVKKDDKSSSCLRNSGNNNTNKGNLPEICILCATTNMSRKNYTLIIHFAEMIMDLSGVDILKSNVSPIACSICFKYVLEMWNFKQQIITADKFIKEKIPKQLGINLISTFGSRNVPKPTPFEYIDSNSPILNDSNKRKKSLLNENVENSRIKRGINKFLGEETSRNSKMTKINEITLVPIEDILKENDYAMKDYSPLQKCTTCRKTHDNLKDCDCEKKQKKEKKEKFVCPVCGKYYPALRSLKRHEVIHKAKQYVCGICNKAFHFKLYLIRHIRKHSIKKPFPCSYCNKRFSTKWNLSQHKRVHTNSLPYKCKLCPAAYRYNITLKKHIRMSHTANEFLRNHQSDNLIKISIQ